MSANDDIQADISKMLDLVDTLLERGGEADNLLAEVLLTGIAKVTAHIEAGEPIPDIDGDELPFANGWDPGIEPEEEIEGSGFGDRVEGIRVRLKKDGVIK